jgi:lipopolysaccharide transport system ATP-binding protein
MEPSIEVKDISKRYIIRHGVKLNRLSEKITHSIKSAVVPKKPGQSEREDFWALRNVSFTANRGEVIGIVGRNGAGKSTLLKVLSRITAPTSGEVIIRGRTGCLLEVGTGFHPELTGGENIFMSGATLGMRRKEIESKFDDIVRFSEVEKFIDTPVKRYSSGMYVRLAFAVAANLDSDVLIVDEVLAVGDASFQRKSLGKLKDVSESGRTVLFVSHNMGALASLCDRGIMMRQGGVVMDGTIDQAIASYIEGGTQSTAEKTWSGAPGNMGPGDEKVRMLAIRVRCEGSITSSIPMEKAFSVEVEFENYSDEAKLNTGVQILDNMGNVILTSMNYPSAMIDEDSALSEVRQGRYISRMLVPGNFLNDGLYFVSASLIGERGVRARADMAVSFEAFDTGAMRKEYTGPWSGVIRPRMRWEMEKE